MREKEQCRPYVKTELKKNTNMVNWEDRLVLTVNYNILATLLGEGEVNNFLTG